MTDIVTIRTRPKLVAGIPVKPVSELPEWGICMAIYGPPGVGKTTTAGKVAYSDFASPAVILDAEGGVRSITHIPNLDQIEVKDWNELSRVSGAIIQAGKDSPWKTVIIDNMSEIQNLNLRHHTGGDIPEFKHWNRNTTDILQFTRAWRDFARFNAVNVIFIAWSTPEADESTGIKIIKQDVGFSPSLARQFPGIVDIVGFLTVETPSGLRILTFAPSNRSAAKFRRSNTEYAAKIPLVIKFDDKLNPLADIIGTLRGGLQWPSEKYSKREDK